MTRVRAGYFYRVNPFNSRQVAGFSLKPEHVDAICFWTRNPRPLLPHLAELDERGLNYYVPPLDSTNDYMLQQTGNIYACCTWHGRKITEKSESVN